MVGAFEQAILALMIAVIMLGMGASLTLKDFTLALKRPYGLFIGLVSQYGFMPFIAFLLALTLPVSDEIKIGLLIMGCMPGGTTSNIFTYFSKGNLALSVLMTVNSTLFGVILIPLLLVVYAGRARRAHPGRQHHRHAVPAARAGGDRHGDPALERQCGRAGRAGGLGAGILFILLLLVSWVPRNWQFLLGTPVSVFLGAIGLGVLGFLFGYLFSNLLKLHPRNSRTIALETGIQNGPLAIAIVALTFAGSQQQQIMAVPALYSLFIVLSSTAITLWWRSRNFAGEQRMPDSLL